MANQIIGEEEIVMHLLCPKIIMQNGVYMKTDPNPYFAQAYRRMIASAPTLEGKEVIIESAQNIAGLVQRGLSPGDAAISRDRSRVVLDALDPLVPLIGSVNGAEDVAKVYTALICGKPQIPTEQMLQSLAEDLWLP